MGFSSFRNSKGPLDSIHRLLKTKLQISCLHLGRWLWSPGAVNAMLVAMLYFLPGSMKVDDPETKLPAWLLPSYNDIFANSFAS